MQKFNEYTDDKYSYLKMSEVNVYYLNSTIEFVMLYPESHKNIKPSDKQDIAQAIKDIYKTDANIEIKFLMSHFDKTYFINNIKKYFKDNFPGISATLQENDIDIKTIDGVVHISIILEEAIFNHALSTNTAKEVKKLLSDNYCEKIEFNFVKLQFQKDHLLKSIEVEKKEDLLEYESVGGRYITPNNVDAVIGKHIYSKAIYIEDLKTPQEQVTICGTLVGFDEFLMKPKEGETKQRKFYRLTLEDFTGSRECLFFPRKYTADKIGLLQKNKQLVVRGNLEKDKKEPGETVMIISDICYCTLPEEFVINRIKRKVDKQYRVIKPTQYVEFSQVSLFGGGDSVAQEQADKFKGKTFVVFDLETTGLNPVENRIIEIGAIKIVDGEFTETFSALIDPQINLPEKIIELTGLCDADLKGKPLIEEVLPDFYKFVQDSILVAHNLTFDYNFISAKGKPMGIYFDNERYDTLAIARKSLPGRRSYSLGNIIKEFDISLENAHRAVEDAEATAKLFLKIF